MVFAPNNNDNDGNNPKPTIPPDLSKQLLKENCPGDPKRIPNETAKAVSELLRLFVLEARSRACVEAECDMEGAADETTGEKENFVPIRADHITKVAADLLMDFS